MDSTDNSLAAGPPAVSRPVLEFLKRAAGYLLAAVCLVWIFQDVDWGRLFEHIRDINWWWVVLAVAVDILSYICQGWRWRLLLHPTGKMSVLKATQAIYVGLFTNEVAPMRLGEVVRAYLASRWLGARFVSIIPSLAVERFFDGIWLAGGIGVAALFVPLPRSLLEAGDILGVAMLLATGVIIYLVFRKRRAPSETETGGSTGWKPLRWLYSLLGHLSDGIRKMGTSRSFYLAFGVSLIFLLTQALALWLVMWAYGLPLSFWAGLVVLLVIHLGTAIPNAPANLGTYQFFCIVGLTLFGIDKTRATGFAFVVFVVLTVPLWAIGFWALTSAGMTLAVIRTEIAKLKLTGA